MRHDHERVAGHAVQLGQDGCRLRERLGHDGHGGDPLFLEREGVEHTARRAAPSIADGGDEGVGRRHHPLQRLLEADDLITRAEEVGNAASKIAALPALRQAVEALEEMKVVGTVQLVISGGIRTGEAIVVIATPEHRRAADLVRAESRRARAPPACTRA